MPPNWPMKASGSLPFPYETQTGRRIRRSAKISAGESLRNNIVPASVFWAACRQSIYHGLHPFRRSSPIFLLRIDCGGRSGADASSRMIEEIIHVSFNPRFRYTESIGLAFRQTQPAIGSKSGWKKASFVRKRPAFKGFETMFWPRGGLIS